MFPPKLIKPYVISFCRRFVNAPQPYYVPVKPDSGAELRDCFVAVENHIAKYGGSIIIGWAIWEWPKVLIEAEFHSIWESPEGERIDLTPKDVPSKRVLFVPDPRRKYEGFQRDNIRLALRRDRDLLRMIELSKLIYEEMNRGDLKFQHGFVSVPVKCAVYNEEKREVLQRLMGRYGNTLADAERYAS